MLVTVVVPIYNVEEYICECIESICAQTYKNIEIILVDDGSTDASGKICDKFSNMDNRIKVIHKENGGLSDARNVGIRQSSGEWICLIDSDDYVQPDMITALLRACVQNDANISICGHRDVYGRKVVDEYNNSPICCPLTPEEAFQEFLDNKNGDFVVAWNKLYKKEIFDNLSYPVGKYHEDCFTTYKALMAASKIVYICGPLYYYRHRCGSIMGNLNLDKEYAIVEAYEEIMSFTKTYFPYMQESAERGYIVANLSLLNKMGCKPNRSYVNRCIKNLNTTDYRTNSKLSMVNKIRVSLFCHLPNCFLIINTVMLRINKRNFHEVAYGKKCIGYSNCTNL